jgi:small subunit ribosomal protein S29e
MVKRKPTKKRERKCKFCRNYDAGLIRKYNLNICRRCFREKGEDLGFRKF